MYLPAGQVAAAEDIKVRFMTRTPCTVYATIA